MLKTLSHCLALGAVASIMGVSAPALADPIYLEHQHGYGGYGYGGHGYDGGHGWGHGWAHGYDEGYGGGGAIYAPVYGHTHCRVLVVHTDHGHHRRRVCE